MSKLQYQYVQKTLGCAYGQADLCLPCFPQEAQHVYLVDKSYRALSATYLVPMNVLVDLGRSQSCDSHQPPSVLDHRASVYATVSVWT